MRGVSAADSKMSKTDGNFFKQQNRQVPEAIEQEQVNDHSFSQDDNCPEPFYADAAEPGSPAAQQEEHNGQYFDMNEDYYGMTEDHRGAAEAQQNLIGKSFASKATSNGKTKKHGHQRLVVLSGAGTLNSLPIISSKKNTGRRGGGHQLTETKRAVSRGQSYRKYDNSSNTISKTTMSIYQDGHKRMNQLNKTTGQRQALLAQRSAIRGAASSLLR